MPNTLFDVTANLHFAWYVMSTNWLKQMQIYYEYVVPLPTKPHSAPVQIHIQPLQTLDALYVAW